MLTQMQQQQADSFFPTTVVLSNSSFFWGGRGGFAITHKGNAFVRSEISKKAGDYLALKRSQRGQVAKLLMANELKDIKFVIERDAVLKMLGESDSKKGRASSISPRRKKSILDKHNSVEQIQSYPAGVCIEVGYRWALDIVNHQLRGFVGETKHQQQQSPDHVESGNKRTRQTRDEETYNSDNSSDSDDDLAPIDISLDAMMSTSNGMGPISGMHFRKLPEAEPTILTPTETELEELLRSPLPKENHNEPKRRKYSHNESGLLQQTAEFPGVVAPTPQLQSTRSIGSLDALLSMDFMGSSSNDNNTDNHFQSMEFLEQELNEEDVMDALAIFGQNGDFNPMQSIDGLKIGV